MGQWRMLRNRGGEEEGGGDVTSPAADVTVASSRIEGEGPAGVSLRRWLSVALICIFGMPAPTAPVCK